MCNRVKAEVPQFQPFFDYVEANGFEADGAYPPTGFEDTKRGKSRMYYWIRM